VLVGQVNVSRSRRSCLGAALQTAAEKLQADAKTVLYVAIDGKPAGLLAVADPIKDSTAEAIAMLHALGVKIVMATGDNQRVAEAVARQLGLDQFEAEVAPADKLRKVNSLKQEGHTVAMAGDGVNDAPALAAADVEHGDGHGNGRRDGKRRRDPGQRRFAGNRQRPSVSPEQPWRTIRAEPLFRFCPTTRWGFPSRAGILYPFFGLLLSPMLAGGRHEPQLGQRDCPMHCDSGA